MIVGGSGTLLDLITYSGLRFLGLRHWLALAISFGIGIVFGFFLSRNWVFRSKDPQWEGQLLRFMLVIAFLYVLNGLVMEGLYWLIPAFAGRSFVIRGVSAFGLLPLSFTLHRRVSFA